MSQGLHLSQRLSQQMILSPQLQQSLALLQAPVLELQALVEQEVAQNPLLEEVPEVERVREEGELGSEDIAMAAQAADPSEPPADTQFDPATERSSTEPVDKLDSELQRLLELDQDWRDHFSAANTVVRGSDDEQERRDFLLNSATSQTSLQEHLLEQVRLADLEPRDVPVAEMLVGNIDDHGFLQSGVAELSFATGAPSEQIEEVLQIIQSFTPPGVGARDLRECLMLQLERGRRKDTLEYRVLRDHFEALTKHRFPEIARHLGVTAADAQRIAQRIARLNPRPGREFTANDPGYIQAEVTAAKVGDDWVVTTQRDHLPHLRISNTYKDLLSNPETPTETREYIRDKIRAGKFLIKSLHQRQDTITRIAQEIVKRQRDFLEHGVGQLKPLTMVQVAEVVGVHETTVSRAVSGKYMATPHGVIELKYFFTSGLATDSGEAVSNTSVKSVLAEMIGSEDKGTPLSDEDLVNRLNAKGIQIARRTVAKYRTELGALPSHLRRTY